MDFQSYQQEVLKQGIYPRQGENYVFPSLGLCGEAGEVAEEIKKAIRDDGEMITPSRKQAIFLELGDVLWYLTQLANELDLSLDEIAEANLKKIQAKINARS